MNEPKTTALPTPDGLEEAVAYYKRQGAPGDQNATVALLRELQQEHAGKLPAWLLPKLAELLSTKESYLRAIIKRIPSLQLDDTHILELCAGPNCGKAAALAAFAETHCRQAGVTLKFVPCMRLCGKGPNLRYDGVLHHRADQQLLQTLLENK